MIVLGGGNITTEHAGYVAMTLTPTGTTAMDTDQITINPTMTVANGVPKVSATASIPAGTLSSGISKVSSQVDKSNLVETLTVTANGTQTASDKLWNKVIVNVAGSDSGTVKAQAVTATPQASSQTITPATGYNYLSSVTINPVPLDSRNGATFTSNTTVTATDGKWFKSFTIAVPNSGGSGTSNIQVSKSANIDSAVASNTTATIAPDSGYDGMSQVTINTTNLYAVTSQEQASEYILSGVAGYQINETDGAHALRPVYGTMVNQGAITKTFTGPVESYTIPAGYHNGAGTVSVNLSMNAYYVGTTVPSASLGNDGDIYLKT